MAPAALDDRLQQASTCGDRAGRHRPSRQASVDIEYGDAGSMQDPCRIQCRILCRIHADSMQTRCRIVRTVTAHERAVGASVWLAGIFALKGAIPFRSRRGSGRRSTSSRARSSGRTMSRSGRRSSTTGVRTAGGLLPSLKAPDYVAADESGASPTDEGAGCDVFGENELRTALQAGVAGGARISREWIGGRSPDLLRAAVEAGNVAHPRQRAEELDDLCAITRTWGRVRGCGYECGPWIASALTEGSDFFPGMSIRDAAQLYKPGIEPGAAREIGRRALSHRGIELTGLMTHLGRALRGPGGVGEDGGGIRRRGGGAV